MDSTVPYVKPRLRGVLHQVAFFIAALAGAWLLTRAQGALFWACVVYVIALCGQLGVSASYHRGTWRPDVGRWWRRLDHAFIMVLIAGTATPLFVFTHTERLSFALTVLWIGAGIGVLRALFWVHAPRWIATGLALALAWCMSPYVPELHRSLGDTNTAWLVAGGLLYSVGAVTYATKRPDPWPKTFGYHEVWHTFVVTAAACQFVAIARMVVGG